MIMKLSNIYFIRNVNFFIITINKEMNALHFITLYTLINKKAQATSGFIY